MHDESATVILVYSAFAQSCLYPGDSCHLTCKTMHEVLHVLTLLVAVTTAHFDTDPQVRLEGPDSYLVELPNAARIHVTACPHSQNFSLGAKDQWRVKWGLPIWTVPRRG